MRARVKKTRSNGYAGKGSSPEVPQIVASAPGATFRETFRKFAAWTAAAAGSPWTFLAAVVFLVLWMCSYPLFMSFPNPFDTWQLVINTVTTIVTFLMVFLIQNTQNRDAKALHLKMDELIRAVKGARNRLVELEDCTDEELESIKREFDRIRREADGKGKSRAAGHVARVEMEEQARRTSG